MNALKATKKLVLINANWFSFLSATLISTSVNFYTGLFGGETLPSKWIYILLSVLLTLLSAIGWGWIAWKLDSIQRAAISRRPQTMDEKTAWDTVMTINDLKCFRMLFILASLLGLVGFLLLPIGSLIFYFRNEGNVQLTIPQVIQTSSTNNSNMEHITFAMPVVSSNKQTTAELDVKKK